MKKLIILSLAFVAALATQADVLYWMVSNDYAKDASGLDTYAYLKVSTENSNTSGTITLLDSASGADVYEAYDYQDQFEYSVPSTYTGNTEYYFFVELANGLKTDPMSYSALKSAGYVYTGGTQLPSSLSATGFGQTPGTTYNVPEPTSGLLFLIGGMLLGLKRRRQQV